MIITESKMRLGSFSHSIDILKENVYIAKDNGELRFLFDEIIRSMKQFQDNSDSSQSSRRFSNDSFRSSHLKWISYQEWVTESIFQTISLSRCSQTLYGNSLKTIGKSRLKLSIFHLFSESKVRACFIHNQKHTGPSIVVSLWPYHHISSEDIEWRFC